MLLLVILLLVFLLVWLAVDISNKAQESENFITISGTGEVYVKPDLGLITFSTLTQASTVAEALSQNTVKMNSVIEVVKKEGVQDKDLKTTNFSIYPKYEWHRELNCFISSCPLSRRVLTGYEVSQSLQVKIRDLVKIGDIIQSATDQGANQVSSLQFTVDDQDGLKEEAREQAIKEAKDKAETLARQLDIKLVRIVNFSEGGQFPQPYYSYATEDALSKGGGAPSIETGENKIQVTVSLTYQIK